MLAFWEARPLVAVGLWAPEEAYRSCCAGEFSWSARRLRSSANGPSIPRTGVSLLPNVSRELMCLCAFVVMTQCTILLMDGPG